MAYRAYSTIRWGSFVRVALHTQYVLPTRTHPCKRDGSVQRKLEMFAIVVVGAGAVVAKIKIVCKIPNVGQ